MIRIGFDTETHLIRRGRLAPRMVCLSLAGRGELIDLPAPVVEAIGVYPSPIDRLVGDWLDDAGGGWSALLVGAKAVATYRALIIAAADPAGAVELVAHNTPFDLAVTAEAAAVHPGSGGPILVETLAALERGTVRDTKIRETLIAIAHDQLKRARHGYFSLAGLVERYLGEDRSAEKGKATTCPTCSGSGQIDTPAEARATQDTMTGGLADAVADLLACSTCEGFGSVGPWRLRYAQLDGVPLDQWPPRAARYALDDAVDALRVCEAQDNAPETAVGPLTAASGPLDEATAGRLIVDEIPQLRAAFGFHLMAARGVCVDAPRTAALDAVVTKIAAEAAVVGVRAGFVRGDNGLATADPDQKRARPGSVCNAAKHALVSEAYAGDPPRNDPTETEKAAAAVEGREAVGSVCADRDVLLSTGNADLIAYAEVGASLTLARTYVPILREGVALGPVDGAAGPCGPITSSPNVLVATGRCSWGKPNWTNPPRDGGFRECVVPRPGHMFVSADWGQVELRTLAQVCLWEGFGDSLARAFIEGRDPHAEFGADLLGISFDDMTARLAAGDDLAKSRRQVAKVANFGFPGGMGAERFVAHARKQGVILHEDREKAIGVAWQLHAAFRQRWPEVLPYFAWVGKRTGSRDDPRRFVARQYVSGRLRGGVGYCDGCNTYFQGLAADGAKDVVWQIAAATYAGVLPKYLPPAEAAAAVDALRGSRQVLFLHDENILEVPCGDGSPRYPLDLGRLTAAAAALTGIMTSTMEAVYTPDIPSTAEAAAMLRWVKGADEKRDDAGRLWPDLPDGAVLVGAA